MNRESSPSAPKKGRRVAVIGGCGHVGLPLGVKLHLCGFPTVLVDRDERAVSMVRQGSFPFLEKDGDAELQKALKDGLEVTTAADACDAADVLVFVTGTPVDEHLKPRVSDVVRVFEEYAKYFADGKLVIMRSTLFPGTMNLLHSRLRSRWKNVQFAFCPERVSQGFALEEIGSLPQIVSAFDDESFRAAYEVFRVVAPLVIRMKPIEAELTKLMANAWRYIEFAIANQFYMIAEENGVDFRTLYQAIRFQYPRANSYASPGFAAGPCLFKDTIQLANFYRHNFQLGHAAMHANEGLADFAVEQLRSKLGGSLQGRNVGLLGMAFKANNDDTRESLAFRVRRDLEFAGANTRFHDPYVPGATPLDELLRMCDAFIICTPHREYRGLDLKKPYVDVWGIFEGVPLDILPGTQNPPPRAPRKP